MSNLYWKEVNPGIFKRLCSILLGLVILATAGCGHDGNDDVILLDDLLLPTDFVLNLECTEVGLTVNGFASSCVRDDPENPFATAAITEFNDETKEDGNKFDLAGEIPLGPTGAKARFYFWATALAGRASGVNQYFTALALHELYTAGGGALGGSINAREQAKKAYRAYVDNYLGDEFFVGPFPDPNNPGEEVFVPVQLNGLIAEQLFNPPAPDYETLWPGPDPVLDAKVALGQWGYTYVEALPPIPADIICNNCPI